MRPCWHRAAQILLLIVTPAALYLPFLNNPLVFDDLGFFAGSNAERYHLEAPFGLRWFPYYTLSATNALVGPDLFWQRLENLCLHVLTGMSLYFLIERLQREAFGDRLHNESLVRWAACVAALIFLLSPAAVYAVGYLIQRSIVMATLFTLLMWQALLQGLTTKSRLWPWLSVLFYFLAVFSKEHAVMAPAVAFAIVVLHVRSRMLPWRDVAVRLWPIFLLYFLIAVYVSHARLGVVGTVYEPHVEEMLAADDPGLRNPWLLSAITQSWLFFKYLLLWLFPNPIWMSIDMREPFAESFLDMPQALGVAGFLIYSLLGGIMLIRGGMPGLFGLAMLAPALLYLTEFSTIRIQEQFVLYRSYLWMPLLIGVIPTLIMHLNRRMALLIFIGSSPLLYIASIDRLSSFRHPVILWDDAVRLIERRTVNAPGIARTYYMRGYYLSQYNLLDQAEQDFNHALTLNPNYPAALKERGRVKFVQGRLEEALADFDLALAAKPNYSLAYYWRGATMERMGAHHGAMLDYQRACDLKWRPACERIGMIY